MISEAEKTLTRKSLEMALAHGAQGARATLCKSSENMISTLNGAIDKVSRCEDSSLSLAIFADGRYGSFSTNKLDEASVEQLVRKAVGIVKMLAEDECRRLPAEERLCRDAISGKEAGIYDVTCSTLTAEDRSRAALEASVYGRIADADGYRLISEEGEYSDSEYDMYLVDTQGLECRHTETSFDYGVEVTIEDSEGDKYSGYAWHSAPFLSQLECSGCGAKAIEKAVAQIGAEPSDNGKYNLVIDSEVASKVVSPLLSALSGYSIQQNNSFLLGAQGQQKFPEGLTIMDMPRIPGQTGSKYFDSEGVATCEAPIIDKGVVCRYFINTYMSGKLGMEPTSEEALRPKVMPWPKPGLALDDLLSMCGDGIYVSDFNGGNCNMATGDFSYGIEGRLIRDGKLAEPVSEMLMTGNFLTLWKGLIACADDARPCMSKLVPSLAFGGVDFNG